MKLSPHEIAHVVQTHFSGVPVNDPATSLPNLLLGVAIALAESAGDTDAMHMSSDTTSTNYGQTDHGLFQISGRWNSERLTRLGDWRDPYNNARMARELFDEWWRKENRPEYMAEKREQDPTWQPSGWRAWSVYNSGTAWRPVATNAKNRFIEQARFGLGAAIPAPRPFSVRGNVADPVGILKGNVDLLLAAVGDQSRGFEDTKALITVVGSSVAQIRAHFS